MYLPNNQEVKISQFADDTTIITNNTDSLKSHLQTIEWFGTVSGLKLSKKKTKAMWLGTMKHSNSNTLEFKSTKNPVKVLGTFLSYNQNKNIEENFLSRIRKNPSDKQLLNELHATKLRLETIMRQKTKGAIIRSKARWRE